MQVEKTFKNSEMDVINELKRSGIKWVRLNFCDPFGFLHQISVNSTEITEEAFKDGLPRLDGSSIKGFKEIYESDMLLKPDPSTFAILPDYLRKALNAPFVFGGTALLIVVGVALDTIGQIQSHLIMRHYDGFMKGGTGFKGRWYNVGS